MRLRCLVAVLALLCATQATAGSSPIVGIPDPVTSTVPSRLVVCPAGDVTHVVRVRDIAANPVQGCPVELRFGSCPAFVVCEGCCTGVTIDSGARTATATSWVDGTASFPLKMGPCPETSVAVTACSIVLGTTVVAAFDQDGDLAITAADATIVNTLIGTTTTSADFNGDGTVTQADLDLLSSHVGHSCAGTVPAQPSTWGGLKTIHR